jgi:hypothetical protein
MKKLENLINEVRTTEENELLKKLSDIIKNDDIIVKTLDESERLSVLVFNELAKALNNKRYEVILDCNNANSKSSTYNILLYKIFFTNRTIQIYFKKRDKVFDICTSCAKCYREQFDALKELHFNLIDNKKTHKVKTTERKHISYDDIVSVVKQLVAILEKYAVVHEDEKSNEE